MQTVSSAADENKVTAVAELAVTTKDQEIARLRHQLERYQAPASF